jgi:hypothetical protein
MENNIIWADGVGKTAVYFAGSGRKPSNYNNLYATDGAFLGHYQTDCTTLAAWQTATGLDQSSISADPLLADPAIGDAHLRSTGGRYDPSRELPPEDPAAWVIDTAPSPCIDAGNPASAYANEPRPNGGRVNIGAYGNTAQASRSYLNSAPVLDNSGTTILLPINQDAMNNLGTRVQAILASAGGDRITDADTADPEGIAVTAVANTHGRWQYKLGSDGTWTDFGAPSETAARLLPADASTCVRFVPELNWTGTVDPGLTFRAWDQTGGLPGGTADTTTNGGTSPFSATTETASVEVRPAALLDADGNGVADALTDGILILRYLFSPSGNWNLADAVGVGAARSTRPALKSFLDGGLNTLLDADGNGTADALTDGILILRYLFSPSGDWEYSDAVGCGSTRTTREAIKAFLDMYNPSVAAATSAAVSDGTGVVDASRLAPDPSPPAPLPQGERGVTQEPDELQAVPVVRWSGLGKEPEDQVRTSLFSVPRASRTASTVSDSRDVVFRYWNGAASESVCVSGLAVRTGAGECSEDQVVDDSDAGIDILNGLGRREVVTAMSRDAVAVRFR